MAGFAMIDGDPSLSPAPSGDFSAWAVIERAAREILAIVYVDKDDRLRWRSWTNPLSRGTEVASPELVDLTTWTGSEGLYSVVKVLDRQPLSSWSGGRPRCRPMARRTYERTDETINGEAWAEAVLADRRDQSLRYVPGDIRPLNAGSVYDLAGLELMEDVVIAYTEAEPSVAVTSRILGMRVTAVDETKRTRQSGPAGAGVSSLLCVRHASNGRWRRDRIPDERSGLKSISLRGWSIRLMTAGSDNRFPKVILEERLTDGSDTDLPAADHRAVFLGEDGALHLSIGRCRH